MPPKKPLWVCPDCGERFAVKNQWHSCGEFSVDDLFARSEPNVRAIFERLLELARRCGPVRAIPQKTRVTLQTRIRFLSLYPRKRHLLCGFLFGRRDENPRFTKIESFSARNHVHTLSVASVDELDDQVDAWVREAYDVGDQRHLDE